MEELKPPPNGARKSSVTLVELIELEDRTILIQDYANGLSLNRLMGERNRPLREAEVQKIIKKLAKGLDVIYQLKIIHRDLNINNVCLHIPVLEPKEEEL